MVYGSVPGRVLWEGDVDNGGLVRVVSETARASWPRLRCPVNIDRARLPLMAWRFVRDCTTYVPERDVQTVRTPWAFVREAVGDCKSTAVFIGSLCRAAGLSVVLRFVVLPGCEYFGHVYAVVGKVPWDPLVVAGGECPSLQRLDLAL